MGESSPKRKVPVKQGAESPTKAGVTPTRKTMVSKRLPTTPTAAKTAPPKKRGRPPPATTPTAAKSAPPRPRSKGQQQEQEEVPAAAAVQVPAAEVLLREARLSVQKTVAPTPRSMSSSRQATVNGIIADDIVGNDVTAATASTTPTPAPTPEEETSEPVKKEPVKKSRKAPPRPLSKQQVAESRRELKASVGEGLRHHVQRREKAYSCPMSWSDFDQLFTESCYEWIKVNLQEESSLHGLSTEAYTKYLYRGQDAQELFGAFNVSGRRPGASPSGRAETWYIRSLVAVYDEGQMKLTWDFA